MQELQRCFQEAQTRAEAAEGQARSLLAANAELQGKTQEEYTSRQVAAARIAELEVSCCSKLRLSTATLTAAAGRQCLVVGMQASMSLGGTRFWSHVLF